MIQFGLANVRRLQRVPPVPLKPITLLVGRNSSGKSTFLRTFPLLRQSLMTRTSSPILWFGDLVDFGSFDALVSRQNSSSPIEFTFTLDSITVDYPRFFAYSEDVLYEHRTRFHEYSDIEYRVALVPIGDRTRICRIDLVISSLELNFGIDIDEAGRVSSLTVNDRPTLSALEGMRLLISSGSIFPEVKILPTRDISEVRFSPHTNFINQIFKILRANLDNRIKDKSVRDLASAILSTGLPSRDGIARIARYEGPLTKKFFSTIADETDNGVYEQIANILYVSAISNLVRAASSQLKSIVSTTLYIGPARVRSERYYRYQDLSVSEIDPDGKNFSMFLNSLNSRQIGDLSNWIASLYGYGISVSRQSGHISINLTEGEYKTNIVDVGYGVSQILPVLGQIWWAGERQERAPRRAPLSLIAIEQPELHLHPAHQALLADAFVGASRKADSNTGRERARMHYLVETHSETLINRLGELIADGQIAADDVQVVIFEGVEGTQESRVRAVQFEEDGVLRDWPYGFFQP